MRARERRATHKERSAADVNYSCGPPPCYRTDFLRTITYGITRYGHEWRPLVPLITSPAPEHSNAALFARANLTRLISMSAEAECASDWEIRTC